MTPHLATLPNGLQLEYALSGPEGAAQLCFVHGLSANMQQFAAQQAHFEGDYRVLLVSLRAHGGLSAPAQGTLEAYTPEALAHDVLALWEQLGFRQVHYVGNSLGGLIGYELLRLAPERLKTLTTFGTTAALESPRALVWTLLTLHRLLGHKGMGWLFSKTASHQAAVAEQVVSMYRRANQQALPWMTKNIASYDYTPLLRAQRLPILLIQGEHDQDVNRALASTLEALRRTPEFRLVKLPGAGHFANLEQPQAFNDILAGFLAGRLADEDAPFPFHATSMCV